MESQFRGRSTFTKDSLCFPNSLGILLFCVSLLLVPASGASNDGTPTLVFHPRPREESLGSRLIWINNETWTEYVHQIDDFLKPYQDLPSRNPDNFIRCNWDMEHANSDKTCLVNIGSRGTTKDCSKSQDYGFRYGRPCFFIHLEKMFNWIPQPYTKFDTTKSDLPQDVRQAMEKLGILLLHEKETYIWFSCDGENSADKEFIGPVQYSPVRAVPTYFYPYKNQKTYLPPFITVQLPRFMPYVVVNIVCKAYAKNIKHDISRSLGAVHFQVLVDFFGASPRTIDDSDEDYHAGDWGPQTTTILEPPESNATITNSSLPVPPPVPVVPSVPVPPSEPN